MGTPTDTATYTYGDSTWGDLLTGYDGKTITYEPQNIGNPVSDGTWVYTWEHGRDLASMTDGTTTWTYTYDANGMRTSRSNGSTTYKYVYNGSSLAQMTVGSNTLYFTSDTVNLNGTTYYYVTNLQGDVIAILNQQGIVVVEYVYDAWGNVVSTTGSMASTLGVLNPIRYRSYVYDQESGLYYLQSRYYDPEIGRFINADSFVSTGGLLGNNMFSYCGNNSVNYIDPSGYYYCTYEGGSSMLDFMNGIVDAGGGGGGGGGVPGCGGASGKKHVDTVIDRELTYIFGESYTTLKFHLSNTSEWAVLAADSITFYKGILVIKTNFDRCGYFGIMFINQSATADDVRHEYGHSSQMEQLGVLKYALCIGLPSWQEWGSNPSYYDRPWEVVADIEGGVVSRQHSAAVIQAGYDYLYASKEYGILAWATIK